MDDKTLKTMNRMYLIFYLFFNFLLFVSLSGFISLDQWNVSFKKIYSPESILAVTLFLISIILEGVFSSDLKAVLIFWKIKDPLPGARAFSTIARNDKRINMDSLKKLFSGKLPNTPKEQNSSWYSLYKKYAHSTIVSESHRWFLLTRDLATLTLLIIPISILAHIIVANAISIILIHSIILLALFLIIATASRNYGNGFVADVLVEAIKEEI